jgi:5'(3')-deoxyribonucleotidase
MKMSSKKNISILIGIIGLLVILLAGSIGFIVASINNVSIISSQDENSEIKKDLENLKQTYESKIADKTNNYYILQIQKDSIKKLVEALEISKKNAATLLKYKDQYQNLESKMKILVDEITVLNGRKQKINATIIKKDNPKNLELSTNEKSIISNKTIPSKAKSATVVTNEKPKTQEIPNKTSSTNSDINTIEKSETSVTELNKKSDKNVKISISNIAAQAFISKSATNKIATTKANKADFFRIQFTINANSDFDGFEKVYYFQIIGPKNNIIGQRKTEYFEGQLLTYSFSKSYFYNGQILEIAQEYLAKDFEKGYYFITIFDRNSIVGKTTLQLE